MSDQDPFSRESLELSEGNFCSAAETLPASVVTDIEGGVPGEVQARGSFDPESKGNGFITRPAILRTVKVEQSHGSTF